MVARIFLFWQPAEAEEYLSIRTPHAETWQQAASVLYNGGLCIIPPSFTPSPKVPMRPNIILLVLDCVRFDGLHVFGNPRSVTPNLDRLAENSRRYTQARSAAIWTLPSHASMFTGLHPRQHGVNVDTRWLDQGIPTMAESLSRAGYQTAAFSTNAWVGPDFGLDRGFEHFSALWRIVPAMGKTRFTRWEKALRKKVLERNDKGARKLNKYVRKWWQKERDPERPFFMFGLYLDAHLPYRPPKGYAERLLQGDALRRARAANQDAWAYMADEVTMTPEDFAGLRALYDAEIAYIDEVIGDLFAFLDSVGALDNTLIAITSDHGENIGDHQLMDHQYCVCDSLARVPLIIHYPDGLAPGDDTTPVQHTDLLPTFLDVAGATPSLPLSGQSLLTTPQSAIANPQSQITQYTAPHRHRFARRHPDFDPASKGYDRTYDAITHEGYKLIRSNKGDIWLYNVVDDPNEQVNLAVEQPERVLGLDAALDAWLEAHPPLADIGAAPELDEALQNHLRGLGYL